MILNPCHFKGMSLISFLVTLTLFSGIFLALNQWGSLQRLRAVEIYQRYQAVQIAENQKQRLFLGLPTELSVTQNGIKFKIQKNAEQITVSYPTGHIQL